MATASKALKQKKAVGGYLLKTFSCPSFLSAAQKLQSQINEYTYESLSVLAIQITYFG
jgi:hypothetical protein